MAKLAKLSMPRKGAEELDLEELLAKEESEAPEDEAMESPEEQEMEDEMGIEKHERPDSNPALASVSDEELLAELAKRGLSAEAEKEPSEPSEESEEYL